MQRFRNWLSSHLAQLTCLLCALSLSGSVLADDKPITPDQNDARQKNISHFVDTVTLIQNDYAKTVDEKKLLEDAIRGMVSNLDPHSEYLDEQSYKALLTSTSGAFGGLGIQVTSEYGVIKIISPMDGSPAAKAGIKPGDFVVAIDGNLVSDMTSDKAVQLMRGDKGTKVTLTILRKSEKKPMTFTLIRDVIKTDSLQSKLLDNNIGYVRISQFQENTAGLLKTAIETLKTQGKGKLEGLILDLRNNPGGLLESAVNVVDLFLDSDKLTQFRKLIVYTEGRTADSKYEAIATGHDMLNGLPLIILVNSGSASASEIVAGALQDYHRAVIVGITSFGKGSVQTVLPLDEKHAIKLTTALYHTPSGRVIQNRGIVPDIRVPSLKIEADLEKLPLDPVREASLRDHLHNDTAGTDNTADNDKDPIGDLAKTDFQLFEAINIVKTLSLTRAK